ncbi:hypothetical protein N9A94_02940 [Akkermansiaceae bacterium]|nr:hypothetical protein [Akkermansiaceae bacterium]MDB4537319.1 hypothetical protein [Akkermansiaceae bacterium]
MSEKNSPERPRDSLWMGLLAMVAFMLWGLYVNWEYGLGSRIQVAMTQGLLGLTATYFSAEIVVWLVRIFRDKSHPALFAGAASWTIIYAIVWLVHFLAGTPEIFYTVLPGMITGIFFSFGYAKRVALYLGPLS